ncbi:Rv1733c family protein [Amycolatopsis acidicola]
MDWIGRRLRWLTSFGNPLTGRWDRFEMGLVIVAVALALGMVPVALSIGSAVRAQTAAQAAEEQASRVPSTAVLLTDVPQADTSPATRVHTAEATWQLPDGQSRTGRVSADAGTRAGTRVPIWLDRAGNAVARPRSTGDALGTGIGVGMYSWVASVALLIVLCWVARMLLNRRRHADLAREWATFSRDLKRF